MFYYLFHSLPLWTDLPNGSRNVRTFLAGTICYIIMHAYLYSQYGDNNKLIAMFRPYIYYVCAADVIAVAIIYKNYYKRTILDEVSEMITGDAEKPMKAPSAHTNPSVIEVPIQEVSPNTAQPVYSDFNQFGGFMPMMSNPMEMLHELTATMPPLVQSHVVMMDEIVQNNRRDAVTEVPIEEIKETSPLIEEPEDEEITEDAIIDEERDKSEKSGTPQIPHQLEVESDDDSIPIFPKESD